MRLPLHYLSSWLLLLLASCGSSVSPQEGTEIGYEGLFSLLTFGDAREVLQAPEDSAPVDRLMRPRSNGEGEYGERRCVVVRAPTTLSYTVPDVHADAVLEYRLAPRANAYQGEGNVIVTATLEGEPLFEHRLDCSPDIPEDQRCWNAFQAPLPRGGELVVRFTYEGTRPRGPFVGLADLRVSVPFRYSPQTSAPEAPNVILFVVDTLRADRLHVYGNPRQVSPNLDRLAREGTTFRFAASSGPWTIPGTASILTGRTAPAHGLGDTRSDFLADRLHTLPELFRRAGARTAAFSTNPLISEARNFDQGFEFFRTYRWAPSGPIREDLLGWLRGIGEDRFFLYIHFTDPHAPYVPADETRSRFDLSPDGDLPVADLRQRLDGWYGGGDATSRDRLVEANRQRLDLYDAEIYEVDSVVGELLQLLDARGLGDRTILAVTSDHGEEFLEHGLVGHYNQLHRESIHVPLLLWGPGVPSGEVVDEEVENRHVAPTLLRLAGIDAPAELSGPDLTRPEERAVASARGVLAVSNKGRLASFSEREDRELGPQVVLRSEGWVLIHHMGRGPEGVGKFDRLFRIADDEGETVDLSEQYPDRVRQMRQQALGWLEAERALRPEQAPPMAETRALMRSLGYIGSDDE